MNKIISKKIFIKSKILTPKYLILKKNGLKMNNILQLLKKNKMGFPIVIKPISEGSSLGVKINKNLIDLKKSITSLFRKYEEIMLEQYIGGQEVQAAVLNNVPLGAIELIPKRSFYDYKAKYTKSAKTEHVMPARLRKDKYNEVLKIAKKAHRILGCKGVSRTDFKFFKNKFYILETNTQPGMTNLSLVPEIASYRGINFSSLIEKILIDASINK